MINSKKRSVGRLFSLANSMRLRGGASEYGSYDTPITMFSSNGHLLQVTFNYDHSSVFMLTEFLPREKFSLEGVFKNGIKTA